MIEHSVNKNTTFDRKQSDVSSPPAFNARAGRGKQVFTFLLGLAIGFGSFWLWDKNNATLLETDNDASEMKNSQDFSKEKNIIEQSENEAEKNSITVVAQGAGNLVVVTEVRVFQPTWAAIHEDVNGVPSNILGAQLFDSGVYSGTVALLRNTESGRRYHAILYKDNGDRLFDYVIDLPIESVSGGVVSASFTTVAESPPF